MSRRPDDRALSGRDFANLLVIALMVGWLFAEPDNLRPWIGLWGSYIMFRIELDR